MCTGDQFNYQLFISRCKSHFSRCGRCLRKTWCSQECNELGWKASHKEFCSQEVEERKVKGSRQERKDCGTDWLDESFKKESVPKEVYRVKKLCKKARSRREASTPAQAENQGAAGVNEGKNSQLTKLKKWLLSFALFIGPGPEV